MGIEIESLEKPVREAFVPRHAKERIIAFWPIGYRDEEETSVDILLKMMNQGLELKRKGRLR